VLWQKRLEKDRLPWPEGETEDGVTRTGRELNGLLDGVELFQWKPHASLSDTSVLSIQPPLLNVRSMRRDTGDLPSSVEPVCALVLSQRVLLDEQTACIEGKWTRLEENEALASDQASLTDEQTGRIEFLEEALRLLRSQRFAPKSEKTSRQQLGLCNEAEAVVHEAEAGEEAIDVPAHKRGKGGRRPLPDRLPRIEVLHGLSDAEKVCPHDASHTLVRSGEEVSERLDLLRSILQVIQHTRPRYACSTCQEGVRIAPMPPQPIPKSQAAPSLLAHGVTSKSVDGLPLYRQEKRLSRIGMELSRSTLASWVGELGEPLLDPMRKEIRGDDVVQCDETPFQVLKEPGKRAESQSYLWVLRGGPREHPLVVYPYDPSRSAVVPKQPLKGSQGFLQTDGYEGYTALGHEVGREHVGCWAHARREFDEALRGQGKSRKKGVKSSAKESKARQGLSQIQKLYALERKLVDATPEPR
jgi:transposase